MRSRIPGLDGLRAVSIVMVVMGHSMEAPNFPGWLKWPRVWDSALGVGVFFALSGYLITGLLLGEEAHQGRIGLREFYLRRAMRILPAAFVYLACLALLSAVWPRQLVDLGDIAPALLFSRNIFGAGSVFTAHYWTLSVEEQFYLLWPAALILISRRWLLPTALLWLAFEPFWIHINTIYYKDAFNPTRLDFRLGMILVGVVIALAEQAPSFRQPLAALSRKSPYVFAFGALGLLICARFHEAQHIKGVAVGYLKEVCVGAILFGAVRGPGRIPGRLLNSRVAQLLGRLSYSIYLWQQPFTMPAGWRGDVPWFAQFPVLLIPIAVFACASYWLIEKPVLRARGRVLQAVLVKS